MALPTVSVVIPCYNAEEWVEEALSSALAQTHPPLEVICVDDGSTDGTLGVLRRVGADSGGGVTVLTAPNGGPSAARNLGMARARGEYIQFLDADDILQRDKIEHQARLVEASDSRPDLIAAAYRNVFLYMDKEEIVGVETDPWVGLVAGRLGITSANLYRRDAVQQVGGWNEDWLKSEDIELAFRLLRFRQSVVLDPVPKTTLRRRIDSHWRRDLRSSLQGWLAIRMDIVASMREGGLLTRERRVPIEQAIFKTIRTVYEYDPELAGAALEAAIQEGFSPSVEEHGRVYSLLFRAVGFGWAQRLHPYWLYVGRLRSALRDHILGHGRGARAFGESVPPSAS